MKILTLVGTRPELIRLSIIIKKLDALVDHVLVYTNQNHDYNLSGIFFDILKIRQPNYYFENKGYSLATFLSYTLVEFEKVLEIEKPDKILVLGDTNSGLLTLVAERRKIPIYHCEAGNRCFDRRVPEETNRRIIDHLSTYNLPYTEGSKHNLLSEGFPRNNVFKTGNPIYEVLGNYKLEIYHSDIIERLGLSSGKFVLVTIHRSENINGGLFNILRSLIEISKEVKIVFPIHPHTADRLERLPIVLSDSVLLTKPLGFFDFVKLEQSAKLVITDSGTVPEETCIFGVPSLIIRNSTERHELIECGASVLVGTDYENIVNTFDMSLKQNTKWAVPADYMIKNVSDIVINILLGH
jgi:UDP-N-acetylglucosamine 2-epimerase (non-hydrolysing)